MIQLEEITTTPTFSKQLENKVLYSDHADDISISYTSTYTIKYVIDGVKKYSNDHQYIDLSQGQYLILNSDRKITTKAKKGAKGLSFFLSQDLMNEIYAYHDLAHTVPRFLEVAQKHSANNTGLLLKEAAQLYVVDPIAFRQQMDHLFILVSESVVKEQAQIEDRFSALKIVKYCTKQELFEQINRTKEYLHDNLEKNITLGMLSRDIGVSKYYLHRLFKELVGYSPMTYLRQIRLEKARYCLQNTNHSIFEIAMTCGFGELSYFSNTFKKYTGISPSQFRKSL
jgi:AraC family transcriptional regulator